LWWLVVAQQVRTASSKNITVLSPAKAGNQLTKGCAQSADRQNPAPSVQYVKEDKAVELVKCLRAFNVTGSKRLIYL